MQKSGFGVMICKLQQSFFTVATHHHVKAGIKIDFRIQGRTISTSHKQSIGRATTQSGNQPRQMGIISRAGAKPYDIRHVTGQSLFQQSDLSLRKRIYIITRT